MPEDDRVDVLVKQGDRSFYVRQSKKALRGYLKKHLPNQSKKVRRQLRTSRDSVAGPHWVEAVKMVERREGQKVNGTIGWKIDAALAPFWPRDSLGRRILRRTPAWKLIPGQLTRNFNIREFGCHDGTGYAEGLKRFKGVGASAARARAKKLADYLERVRARHGDRPLRLTSVYRTDPYNARIGGATDSAHTRGYAEDSTPPSGVSLSTHRSVCRDVFPSGIGFYPQANFIHADFDPTLGRREWNGP